MTQNSAPVQEEVILGKTHFQIPGYDEVIPFSQDAIARDMRGEEMIRAINNKLQEKIVLGDTYFTYPGESDPILHSAEAIANDQRHIETMRLTGLEMIRRANLPLN